MEVSPRFGKGQTAAALVPHAIDIVSAEGYKNFRRKTNTIAARRSLPGRGVNHEVRR